MVFHWSLSDKFPQAFRTLLSILIDLNNAVVGMISTCPLISKFSSPSNNTLGILPSAAITIGITVTFLFDSFFKFSSKVFVFISLFAISKILLSGLAVRQVLFFLSFFFF